jgi:16S rRNA (guanine527-N7)-methyltransferase
VFHVKHSDKPMENRPNSIPDLAADKAKALRLVSVSEPVTSLLTRYVDLLAERSDRFNLISRSTRGAIWTRHIADSLQLLALAPAAKIWIDLGSGAGFPGLPIACALAGRPGATVHLVESTGKKAAFLREAIDQLKVPAIVHHVRIEDFVKNFRESADVVTARAVAPLDKLLSLAAPLLKKSTVGLFLKGQDVDAELTQASKYWNIDAELVPSKTSPQSRIVIVRGLRRRPENK